MFLRHTLARLLACRADKLDVLRQQALSAGRFATADVLLDQICELRVRSQSLR